MRVVLAMALGLLVAGPALAQKPQVELKGSVSWALSEGISFPGQEVDLPGGPQFFNRLDLANGWSAGGGVGVYIERNTEIAFLYDYQWSELVAKGSNEMKIGDQGIDNYHAVVIYNFGSYLDEIRPILFGGLGATYFRNVNYRNLDGDPRSTGGEGRFSSTWGAGLKWFPGRTFGLQFDFKWTPTWIKSEPGGWYCDPYWGCGTVSNHDYANQWKFGGTLIARF